MREFIEILMSVVFAIGYGIWWLIGGVFSLVWQFVKAVLGNIYGRVVAGTATLVLAYLASLWAGLI